jgi:hypothetical protein
MSNLEFNFVRPGLFDLPEIDRWGFDPADPNVVEMGEQWTLADIAVAVGLFPSKNVARKNGWKGDIPIGFTTLKKLGKLNKVAHIHNAPNNFYTDSDFGKEEA